MQCLQPARMTSFFCHDIKVAAHDSARLMNTKIKVLALIHIMLGGGGMAACMAAYLTWIKLASDAHSLRTAHTLGQMMFMLSMFILLPSLICGIGLLLDKSWGRVVAIGWSMLLLPVVPIGTLLGGYGLWVLLKQTPIPAYPVGSERSFSPTDSYHPHDVEPRRASALTDKRLVPSGRARLLLVMLIVGASMVVALRAGFWIAGQQPPSVIVEPFQIAAVLLFAIAVASVVVAARGGLTGPSRAEVNRPVYEERSASPLNREAICIHLQPIERAMLGFGIPIAHQPGRDAQANCQVDRVELALVFDPTVSALYVERHDIDRSYLDPKSALFWCATCNSRLWVVHADAATANTPWFPENALHARTSADVAAL